jgi:acyl-CoA synthetase (AMP-forming)/AMP-acid ligase II
MLFQNLVATAGRAPSTSGIRQGGTFYPYAQLIDRIERIAAGYESLGVGLGDRVALLVPNSAELFQATYALYAIGAVAVPLNAAANPRELLWAGEKCEIKAVVARPEAKAVAERLIAEMGGTLPLVLTTGPTPSIEAFAAGAPANLRELPPETDAIYLFSSGSTGRSKIVPHTHREMVATGRIGARALQLQPDDVLLNSLPGHHALGYLSGTCEVATAGGTTVYWSDPLPLMLSRGRLLKTIEAERVTVMPGVPFVYDTLAGVTDEVDLSSLRLAYCGGIALKRPVFEKVRDRFGIPLRQSLGMTEVGQICFNLSPDIERTWEAVGKPLGDVSIEVRPSADAPSADVGELFLKAPALTRGYLKADPAANLAFQDGGMLMGDLGRIDEDGNVYVTGRSKLILEVAGQKIDPIEVEDVLVSHPAVAEAVVVGVPDPRTGEQRLKAVIVKKAEESADELIKFSKARLSAHKVPALVEFRDAIPKSATGKILRGQLLD